MPPYLVTLQRVALLAFYSRAYRADYATFEDYCKDRWGMARRTAYQLLNAADVVENVRHCAQILPANERQARPLTRLEPEDQRAAWKRAGENRGSRGS